LHHGDPEDTEKIIKPWRLRPRLYFYEKLSVALEPISKPVSGYEMNLHQPKMGNRGLKSPFEKGGFRGILGTYINPPYPPFSKGGDYMANIVFGVGAR
jgi:hypothetical protein